MKKEEVIPLGDLESSFLSFKGDGARRAYRQSYSFVKYLIDNYGISRLSELLLQLSRGKGINDAVVNAYSDHGKSLEVLFKEWRDSQT